MELLSLACLCLVTLCGITAAGGKGPEVQKVVVEEGSDAMLPCSLSTKQDIQSQLFDWKKDGGIDEREVFLYDKRDVYSSQSGQSDLFKGRVSHFPGELKNGNASITITNTKLTHSGNYTCEFPRLRPPQEFHVELFVGAAPKPNIQTLNQTDSWALLQCEAQGSPEPTVEWRDSDGKTLPAGRRQTTLRGGRQYFTVNATVNRTSLYRCIATQEKFNHQIHAETYVHIGGGKPERNSGSSGWIGIVVAVLSTLLVVGVVLAVLRFRGCMTLNCNKASAANSEAPEKEAEPLQTWSSQRPDPAASAGLSAAALTDRK